MYLCLLFFIFLYFLFVFLYFSLLFFSRAAQSNHLGSRSNHIGSRSNHLRSNQSNRSVEPPREPVEPLREPVEPLQVEPEISLLGDPPHEVGPLGDFSLRDPGANLRSRPDPASVAKGPGRKDSRFRFSFCVQAGPLRLSMGAAKT